MHLRCRNCGFTAHESRFVNCPTPVGTGGVQGKCCPKCRATADVVSVQPNQSEGQMTGSVVNPVGAQSGVAQTVSGVSDTLKVALVVGGVAVVWLLYLQYRAAKVIVPAGIHAIPNLIGL